MLQIMVISYENEYLSTRVYTKEFLKYDSVKLWESVKIIR